MYLGITKLVKSPIDFFCELVTGLIAEIMKEGNEGERVTWQSLNNISLFRHPQLIIKELLRLEGSHTETFYI